MMFDNRKQAGQLLAQELLKLSIKNPIVIGIPRGGVIIAYQISSALHCPLDIIAPHKIPSPMDPEIAIGSVAPDGTAFYDETVIHIMHVHPDYLDAETRRQLEESQRRMQFYRRNRPYPDLKDKTVVLADDGIATGMTLKAALHSIQSKEPASIIIAVPVAPRETLKELRRHYKVICLHEPDTFYAVGQFYKDFEQITDDMVIELCDKSINSGEPDKSL
ncbi:MAG: putative phosphoribosyl transferase [Clostridiales bacterium]|nr:putative phosphoribosyl transferase [Clostridiales bacterium]